jgi:hypothetical protein
MDLNANIADYNRIVVPNQCEVIINGNAKFLKYVPNKKLIIQE